MPGSLFVVVVTVADLRREPVRPSRHCIHDDLQESQLLCNEMVSVTGEEGEWYRVEAIEQQKRLGPAGWTGYPGWALKEALAPATFAGRATGVIRAPAARLLADSGQGETLGLLPLASRVTIIANQGSSTAVKLFSGLSGLVGRDDVESMEQAAPTPSSLVAAARLFLGTPYLWGGRSIGMGEESPIVTGVDCSGLTHLVYRLRGIDIPRDAHHQWLSSEAVSPDALQAADLIFLSGEASPAVVTHVMFSLGGEHFIEAAETGSVVREATFQEKFGDGLSALKGSGYSAGGRNIYFGRVRTVESGKQ